MVNAGKGLSQRRNGRRAQRMGGVAGMMTIREYTESDWEAIERIHDRARKIELKLAGLEDAFLPLSVAAGREGLFDYPGLFVAEQDGEVVGFAACTEDELAWLYVDPAHLRKGEYRISFKAVRYSGSFCWKKYRGGRKTGAV